MTLRVTLSPADLLLAHEVAQARNDDKERRGIASKKIASRSDLSIHELGARAEIAVARLLGVDIDRTISPSGDNGYDLRYRGATLDVKMRSRGRNDLVTMPDMADFTADYAVLCWPGQVDGVIEIVGLVSRARFRREASPHILRAPPRLVLHWRNLTPING